MKKLSQRLQDVAQGEYFDGQALRMAYDSDLLSEGDKKVIARYMHGSEMSFDRFRLQTIVIKLNESHK